MEARSTTASCPRSWSRRSPPRTSAGKRRSSSSRARPQGTRVVQLAGPVDLTLAGTAAALTKVAGKQVNAVSVPLDAMIGSLTGMGASREVAELYAEMTGAINEGRMKFLPGEIVRGSTTLETKLGLLLK
jgi:uncharacterized protein YbjT (DUF2867 family)